MSESPSLDRFSELIDAAAGVVGEIDLERVLRRLVTEARSATGARFSALGVIGEHGVLSDFLYEGIGEDEAARIGALPTGRGVLGAVIRLNKTIRLDQISDHPDAVGFPIHHPPMGNFLGVPVAVGDEAFGNLYLTEKDGGFSDQDVVVVEALSRVAGAAVRTARLQDRLRLVAVVEDRQRIARELHDSVIQELFAVGLALQGMAQLLDDAGLAATLDDAVDRLDHAVEELRGYIFELKDAAQEQSDLGERVRRLVARMASAYPADVHLEVVEGGSGDETVDDEIMKIVTEALSNALRHASASLVEVVVAHEAEQIVARVGDDGVGFDPDSQSTGMGLENLRVRAALLSGAISIVSRPGEGTKLEARFPIRSRAPR